MLGASRQPLIFGQDDRLEVYEHPEVQLRVLAKQSALALIKVEHLRRDLDGSYRIEGPNLTDAFEVCSDQRFALQPAVAECSAVLVDVDLALTSGHCMTSDDDCTGTLFVFDYFFRGGESAADASATSRPEPEPIEAADVYSCRRVVARRHASNETTRVDFAFVQLDRPASDRTPVTVRGTPVLVGEALTTIGCTSGLPLKIDAGSHALYAGSPERGFFVLDSDTFAGSSGSGVFDAESRLVGIIARGGVDYVRRGGCMVPVTASPEAAPDGGVPTGEEATHATRAVAELCAAGWPGPHLCPLAAQPAAPAVATCSSASAGRKTAPLWYAVFGSVVARWLWRAGAKRMRRKRFAKRKPSRGQRR